MVLDRFEMELFLLYLPVVLAKPNLEFSINWLRITLWVSDSTVGWYAGGMWLDVCILTNCGLNDKFSTSFMEIVAGCSAFWKKPATDQDLIHRLYCLRAMTGCILISIDHSNSHELSLT